MKKFQFSTRMSNTWNTGRKRLVASDSLSNFKQIDVKIMLEKCAENSLIRAGNPHPDVEFYVNCWLMAKRYEIQKTVVRQSCSVCWDLLKNIYIAAAITYRFEDIDRKRQILAQEKKTDNDAWCAVTVQAVQCMQSSVYDCSRTAGCTFIVMSLSDSG